MVAAEAVAGEQQPPVAPAHTQTHTPVSYTSGCLSDHATPIFSRRYSCSRFPFSLVGRRLSGSTFTCWLIDSGLREGGNHWLEASWLLKFNGPLALLCFVLCKLAAIRLIVPYIRRRLFHLLGGGKLDANQASRIRRKNLHPLRHGMSFVVVAAVVVMYLLAVHAQSNRKRH